MKSDPFAPSDHPRHAKNITTAALLGDDGPQRNRFAELLELHLTPHEQDANVSPSVEEVERRQTLVQEFLEQLDTEGPDAELPTLEDETGALYQWHEGDRPDGGDGDPDGQPDGTTSSGWRFVGDPGPVIPPRNGPGSDTDTWRAFAAQVTTTSASWATMTRGEIIAALEAAGKIPADQ